MTAIRTHLGRLAAAAGLAALFAGAAMAQDAFPTTAQLFAVPDGAGAPIANGEHVYSEGDLSSVFAPIHQLRSSLTSEGSTTLISQLGDTNFASSGMEGVGNLSAISQTGNNNRAVQAIQGNNSAMLLVQGGDNNNVLQASNGDNNLQLVGVNGSHNDVAYLQAGNNLSGALNVGGTNSAVLAVQTEASGRYLMPSGITGLNNQVVIVVPGRMYVFNR